LHYISLVYFIDQKRFTHTRITLQMVALHAGFRQYMMHWCLVLRPP